MPSSGWPGARSPPSQSLPTDTLRATLPDVRLGLEVRPLTATGLIFHLGSLQAPPYLQLHLLEKQVSWAGAVSTGQDRGGRALLTPAPPQVLLWADDGAGKFSTLVTLSRALCDRQWHQLAGELGPCNGHRHCCPPSPAPAEQKPGRDLGGGSAGPPGRGLEAKQHGTQPLGLELVRGSPGPAATGACAPQ